MSIKIFQFKIFNFYKKLLDKMLLLLYVFIKEKLREKLDLNITNT